MKQLMTEKINLFDQLVKLEKYYGQLRPIQKKVKPNPKDPQSNLIQLNFLEQQGSKLIIIFRNSYYFSQIFLKSDYSIFIPSSEKIGDDENILGNLHSILCSLNSKINYASFNFENKTIEINFESIVPSKTTIQNLRARFESFGTMLSQDVLGHISELENLFLSLKKFQFYTFDDAFIENLIQNQSDQISMIQKMNVGERLTQQFYINEQMLSLMGILPNVFIDSVIQSNKIPSLISQRNCLEIWLESSKSIIQSFAKPYETISTNLITLFEGTQVFAQVKRKFYSGFNSDTSQFQILIITTFEIPIQQKEELFNRQRIYENSAIYLSQNEFQEKNKEVLNNLQRNLKFQTLKWRTDKPCGFKNI